MGYSLTEYGVKYYAASDDLLLSNDDETFVSNLDIYEKVKEIRINERIVASTFRFKYQVKTGGAGSMNSRIYKNGEYLTGNQYATNNAAWTQATDRDISDIREGDLIQMYLTSYVPIWEAYVRNFRVYGIETIGENTQTEA
jgi:hypothetical protein